MIDIRWGFFSLTRLFLKQFGDPHLFVLNLNLIQEFWKTLKKYWWMMMLQLSVVALYLGYDLINRSEELSEDEKAMLLQNETLK